MKPPLWSQYLKSLSDFDPTFCRWLNTSAVSMQTYRVKYISATADSHVIGRVGKPSVTLSDDEMDYAKTGNLPDEVNSSGKNLHPPGMTWTGSQKHTALCLFRFKILPQCYVQNKKIKDYEFLFATIFTVALILFLISKNDNLVKKKRG